MKDDWMRFGFSSFFYWSRNFLIRILHLGFRNFLIYHLFKKDKSKYSLIGTNSKFCIYHPEIFFRMRIFCCSSHFEMRLAHLVYTKFSSDKGIFFFLNGWYIKKKLVWIFQLAFYKDIRLTNIAHKKMCKGFVKKIKQFDRSLQKQRVLDKLDEAKIL